MIKANELRIGNRVRMKVPSSVDNDWFETTIEAADFTGIELGEKLCEPIPLTPEILESCGFEKHVWNNGLASGVVYTKEILNGSSIEYSTYSVRSDNPDFAIVLNDGTDGEISIIDVCKYPHQLQNIYLSLTSEELKINLNVATAN